MNVKANLSEFERSTAVYGVILEVLLFIVTIGPAVILRTRSLCVQAATQDSNSTGAECVRTTDGEMYLDYSRLFEGDSLKFIYAMISALVMLVVCVKLPRVTYSLPEQIKKLMRYFRQVSRYYSIFLMGVLCLSITLDVTHLNINLAPNGLLYAFLSGNLSANETKILGSRILFPSYQSAMSGYTMAFLLLSTSMLMRPRKHHLRHFGGPLLTMTAIIGAVMGNIQCFVTDVPKELVTVMCSFAAGICAAYYVVVVLLKCYPKHCDDFDSTAECLRVNLMASPRDMVKILARVNTEFHRVRVNAYTYEDDDLHQCPPYEEFTSADEEAAQDEFDFTDEVNVNSNTADEGTE